MAAGTGKVLGVLLVLYLASSHQGRQARSSSRSSKGRRDPTPPVGTGHQVPLKLTGGDDFAAWVRPRRALTVVDLATMDPPVDPAAVDDVATALLAQWARETNKGRAEFNFNLGGWSARDGDDFHTATDGPASGFSWTAYPDLPTAIEDQVKRLAVGFPSAWATLLADPRSSAWIGELKRGGYFILDPEAYAQEWSALADEIRRLP